MVNKTRKSLIHLKSSVSGKIPTAEQLNYGEIAINYAKDSEAIFFKNSENNVVEVKTNSAVVEELNTKQDKTDNALATTAKTVTGAINEINTKVSNIPTVNDPKVSIKMNGAEKGSFTLNQASAGEVDLGTVLTAHQSLKTINGKTITGIGNITVESDVSLDGNNEFTGNNTFSNIDILSGGALFLYGELEGSISIENSGDNDLWVGHGNDPIRIVHIATPTGDSDATNKSYVDNALKKKQDTLTSGTNIKTINNQSILGSGDISVKGDAVKCRIYSSAKVPNVGDGTMNNPWFFKLPLADVKKYTEECDIVEIYEPEYEGTKECPTYSLYRTFTGYFCSAFEPSGSGYFVGLFNGDDSSAENEIGFSFGVISTATEVESNNAGPVSSKAVYNALQTKQDKLISGTNIKTINGESVLGSGDITITSSGGAYPEVNHGTGDTTFTLTPNTFHVWDEVTSLTLNFGSGISGMANEYLFQFTSGPTATSLALPDDIKWANDNVPTIGANMIYQVSVLRGLASVLEFNNPIVFPIIGSTDGNANEEYAKVYEYFVNTYNLTSVYESPSNGIIITETLFCDDANYGGPVLKVSLSGTRLLLWTQNAINRYTVPTINNLGVYYNHYWD